MPHPKGTEMNSEQRARELLADELEADGRDSTAAQIRAGKTPSVVTGIALRAIARALEQPASAAGVEGWRPIETAPRDGTLVILASEQGCWMAKYQPVYQSGYRPENPWSSMMLNHEHIGGYEKRYAKPTHWMPLPAAPKPEDAS